MIYKNYNSSWKMTFFMLWNLKQVMPEPMKSCLISIPFLLLKYFVSSQERARVQFSCSKKSFRKWEITLRSNHKQHFLQMTSKITFEMNVLLFKKKKFNRWLSAFADLFHSFAYSIEVACMILCNHVNHKLFVIILFLLFSPTFIIFEMKLLAS